MPSDIDVFPPNVEPPREKAPGPEPTSDHPEAVSVQPAVPIIEGSDDLLAPTNAVEPALGFSTTSSDDLTASLTHARPDPLLGAFVTEDSPAETAPDVDAPAEEIQGQGPHPGSRADAMMAFGAIDLGGVVPTAGSGLPASSTDAFAAFAIDQTPPAKSTKAEPEPDEEEEEDEDDDDDSPPARGSSLAMMLLASYASAVTFGLIWVLWTGRRLPEAPEPDEPVDARSDPGSRAGGARRIVAPKAILAEHLATLGKTVRLGQIEATPLGVTSGTVELERNFDGRQTKSGGENALKLRLRLKNVSADAVIAPLDEAYLRDRPKADPDSFIETSAEGGATPIAQFPLAVESEWSIVGQQFRDLKPGESYETIVVSAPDAVSHKAPKMTWRIRLRTDLNHTDDLGVGFGESDIKPGP